MSLFWRLSVLPRTEANHMISIMLVNMGRLDIVFAIEHFFVFDGFL